MLVLAQEYSEQCKIWLPIPLKMIFCLLTIVVTLMMMNWVKSSLMRRRWCLLKCIRNFRHCDKNINANIVPVDMTVCKKKKNEKITSLLLFSLLFILWLSIVKSHYLMFKSESFWALCSCVSINKQWFLTVCFHCCIIIRWMRWLYRHTMLRIKKMRRDQVKLKKKCVTFRSTTMFHPCKIRWNGANLQS